MKVLFILPAQTILDGQNRVMGWRQTPALREKLKELKGIVPRLKELGVEKVISSDLDGQSGWMVARNLGLKCEEWHSLRRFNYGKLHGVAQEKAEEQWKQLEEKWKANPDIPIHSGDSWTSFKNRMEATKERLGKAKGTAVVVLGPFELQQLTGAKMPLERNHVYEWTVNGNRPA